MAVTATTLGAKKTEPVSFDALRHSSRKASASAFVRCPAVTNLGTKTEKKDPGHSQRREPGLAIREIGLVSTTENPCFSRRAGSRNPTSGSPPWARQLSSIARTTLGSAAPRGPSLMEE